MNAKQLMKQLDVAHAEKDVESAYRTMFYNNLDNCIITSPCISDGLMKGDGVHCLIEVKYKKDFTKASNRQSVIIQCIFYLKQLQTKYSDDPLPTSCFVGDTNECFIFETRPILKCLDNDNIDWSYSPSQAYQYYHDDLIQYIEIVEGSHKYYYVDENFSISSLVNDLKQYHRNPSYTNYNRSDLPPPLPSNRTIHTDGDITADKITIIKSILNVKPYISSFTMTPTNTETTFKSIHVETKERMDCAIAEVEQIIKWIANESDDNIAHMIRNMNNDYKLQTPDPMIVQTPIIVREPTYQATKYIGNNTILTDIVDEVDDLFHKFKEFIKPHIYFDTVFIFISFILMLCTIFYFGFYIQP
jgi:hypothetical protein